MSDTDRTGALKRKVKDTVDGDERFSEEFADYWELFEAATEYMEIRSFYIWTESGASFNNSLIACDIAAICDGLLIDLDVNKPGYSAATGDLWFIPLSAIGSVNLHPGGVQDLQDTRDALLTVTVTVDDDQRYWFAKTEDEWGYLLDFAQDLMRRIAAR